MNNEPEFKTIANRERFQKQVVKAVTLLADPVKATLGPDGLPILIERTGLPPLATKDGVTVASSVFVDDHGIDTIIQAIKEAAVNTNSVAGDGTTTAILLTESFIKQAQPYLNDRVTTPQKLCDALMDLTSQICMHISASAIQVNKDPVKVKDVAMISCNGDVEIADAVVQAIDAVGQDGVITLEDSVAATVTNLRVEEGFAINRSGYGVLGPLGVCLINSRATQEAIYSNPAVVLYNGILDNAHDLAACVNNITEFSAKAVPITIMAHDFSPAILRVIFEYVIKGQLQCLTIKIPKLGSQYSQSQVLDDLACLTGGKVVQPGINTLSEIKNTESVFLGSAEKVIMSRKSTIVYGGKGSAEEIKIRAADLKQQAKDAPSDFDRDILKERLGRLVGGVAVIEVGGATDLEMKEKRDRIEDALNATRAALEEGVVAGGGTTLLRTYHELFGDKSVHTFWQKVKGFIKALFSPEVSTDRTIALEILHNVCESSLRQIVLNTGKRSPDTTVHEIIHLLDQGYSNAGYNARENAISEDLVSDGVIDPVKVLKIALTNAVSIAITLLRSGGSIVVKSSKINNDQLDDSLPDEDSTEE